MHVSPRYSVRVVPRTHRRQSAMSDGSMLRTIARRAPIGKDHSASDRATSSWGVLSLRGVSTGRSSDRSILGETISIGAKTVFLVSLELPRGTVAAGARPADASGHKLRRT
jgi:hypothetical protein